MNDSVSSSLSPRTPLSEALYDVISPHSTRAHRAIKATTLFSLPAELRNRIYQLYFGDIGKRIRGSWMGSDDCCFCFHTSDLDIFLVSHQVNAEAASWFWNRYQNLFRGACFMRSRSIRSIAAAWKRHTLAFNEEEGEPEVTYNLDSVSWYGYRGIEHAIQVDDLVDLLEKNRVTYDEAGKRPVLFTGRHEGIKSMRLPIEQPEVPCNGEGGPVWRGEGPWYGQERVACCWEHDQDRSLEFYRRDEGRAWKFEIRFDLKDQALWLSGPMSRLDWALMREDVVEVYG